MSLHIDNKNIDAIYYGKFPIAEIWKNGNMIWQNSNNIIIDSDGNPIVDSNGENIQYNE